jgi:hypothetical protein
MNLGGREESRTEYLGRRASWLETQSQVREGWVTDRAGQGFRLM